MALPIILDKSAFQSLSYKEMIWLTNYYLHNITPFLIVEILGDLKKDFSEGIGSENKVAEFSNKLFPYCAIVNEYHITLVKGELLGHKVELDYRPIAGNASLKTSATGKIGKHIEQSQEEQDLLRWSSGDFQEKDAALAQIWRETTTNQESILNLQKMLKLAKVSGQKLTCLEEVNKEVSLSLDDPNSQFNLLNLLFQNYGIRPGEAAKVLNFWVQMKRPLIKNLFPYAHHCLRVDFFYIVGLEHSLISIRATNKVDMNYFYYVPFTRLLTSNDKIHKELAPYFLTAEQDFIDGTSLKADLKKINEYVSSLSEELQKRYYKDPPRDIETLTFSLYKKYFHIPNESLVDDKPKEWYKEKIDEFINASATGRELDSNAGEFIVKKSMMKINDPCPCGSGKPLKNCHLLSD